MTAMAWPQLIALVQAGADLTGLCVLTALLAISGWTCLHPQPVLRQTRPSAGQSHSVYLLLCAFAAPLLMFASLACGLALLVKAQPMVMAAASPKQYRMLAWLLYGVVGLQQLFALQRLAFRPASRHERMMPLVAGALLLVPAAMALGLLALDRMVFQDAGMPHFFVAAASLAAVVGIVLWLPLQLMTPGGASRPRCEPVLGAAPGHDEPALAIMADSPTPAFPSTLSTAQEMEMRLRELSTLLDDEKKAAEQASHHALLEKDEVQQASTIQQQVNEQKFLFESGLPCNLGLLVNGLVILDRPLDLRDHVRGDSLLHVAVREGNAPLVQQLIEHDADIGAVNWAGVNARACTQDAAIHALLDAAAGPAK